MVRIDVASDSSIKEAAGQVESYVGKEGLNILINNGGVFSDKSPANYPSREGMLEVFNINTIGKTSSWLLEIQVLCFRSRNDDLDVLTFDPEGRNIGKTF